jgi:hypothetical protein
MDDAEFKRKLSEVAEWKIPETPRETSLNAKKKRGRPSQEEQYQELREEIFFEEFGGENPTYPPMLIKVHCQAVNCDDCGKLCEQGRRKEAKLHEKHGKRVWREKCVTCNRFQNPFNGEFELTGSMASMKFNDFMRKTKGAYQTRGNELRRSKMVTHDQIVSESWEDDLVIITSYHDLDKG